MTIRTTQKIIKIGSSAGVTLPARDLKNAGFAVGDDAEITVKHVQSNKHPHRVQNITAEYEAFKAQYGQTLKNLANR